MSYRYFVLILKPVRIEYFQSNKFFGQIYESMNVSKSTENRVNGIAAQLTEAAIPEKVSVLSSFFKTGKGEYGEGDVFIGVKVPDNRKVAKRNADASPEVVEALLDSPVHEHRLCALLILVEQYVKGDASRKEEIYTFYLSHTSRINNWDLVDLSAPNIVGRHLLDADKTILRRLAMSYMLWERRIAVVSTLWFVRKGVLAPTLELVEMLLGDRESLMHKACGWALREVGKKDRKCLTDFLDKHASDMPRTMLRYAIEKFDKEEREHYMRR